MSLHHNLVAFNNPITSSIGYRPTTGLVGPNMANGGSNPVIDTTSSDSISWGASSTHTWTFSGFGSGIVSGTLNLEYMTGGTLGFSGVAGNGQVTYACNSGSGTLLTWVSDHYTHTTKFLSATSLTGVDLSTLNITVSLTGSTDSNVYINLYDVVFIKP